MRFNNKLVLEAGYRIPTRFDKAKPGAMRVSGGYITADAEEIKSGKDKDHKGYA